MSSMGKGKEMAVDDDFGKWPPNVVRVFVHLMEEAVDKDNLKSNTFDDKVWHQFTVHMKYMCGRSFTVKQLRDKNQRLKAEWRVFSDMKKQSGFGWDEVNETITAEKHVWDNYLKARPKAKKFEKKGLANFDVLTKIFEESTAQGNVSRASTQRVYDSDEERRVNYEFAHPNQPYVNVPDEDDDVPFGSGSGSRKRKSGTSSGRGTNMSYIKEFVSSVLETQEVKRSRLKKKIAEDSNVSVDRAYAELDQCTDIINAMSGLDCKQTGKALNHLIDNPRVCHTFLRMTPEVREWSVKNNAEQ